MTKDQVYKRIAEVLQARPRSDLAVLRDELNHELKEKGWEIGPFTTYGAGIGCDVNEIPVANSVSPISHSQQSRGALTGGVTCSRCNTFNKYLDAPSEPDGTHICYACKIH